MSNLAAETSPLERATAPPAPTRNIPGDVLAFLLHRPAASTRIDFAHEDERANYSKRILQRLEVDVTRYSVLNLHRIGIEAPVRYVFDELLGWDGYSTCWPNHVAKADRVDLGLEHIKIRPLGLRRIGLGGKLGWNIPPLFDLTALRIHRVPGEFDPDNARYLLYECSGGYPIGFFTLYVRSPIAEQGESEAAQVFLAVGFNFYGKEAWPLFHPINRIWEGVHNRVTANVLNRLKQLCEWRFERVRAGLRPL